MVATAAGLAGIPAHTPAAEYHNPPLWPRYVSILQVILDVLKGEEVVWFTEEA